jgi:hypothetical protein
VLITPICISPAAVVVIAGIEVDVAVVADAPAPTSPGVTLFAPVIANRLYCTAPSDITALRVGVSPAVPSATFHHHLVTINVDALTEAEENGAAVLQPVEPVVSDKVGVAEVLFLDVAIKINKSPTALPVGADVTIVVGLF